MWKFEFWYPYFLLLSFLFFVFILFLFFKEKKKIISFSWYEDLKKIYKKDSFLYFLFFVSLFFIFLFFTFIFAEPRILNVKETESKNWIDIALILDVSYSMEANDLKPSRIEVAKKVISDFISKLHSDRVWVVLFAWKPFTSVPLSFDYNFLKDFITMTKTSTIDQRNFDLQGTAMGDALLLGTSLFEKDKEENKRQKIIILVTDGAANKWIDPNIALKLVKEKNIKVYTIWVWWLWKTYLETIDNFWNSQNIEIDWVDEKSLKNIALSTNGKYYRAISLDTLASIFNDIWKLEKTKQEVKHIKVNKEIYDIFTVWILFFMGILFFTHFRNIKF